MKINYEGNTVTTIGNGAFLTTNKLSYVNVKNFMFGPFIANNQTEIKYLLEVEYKNVIQVDAFHCSYKFSTFIFVGNVYSCFGINANESHSFYLISAYGKHTDLYTSIDVEAMIVENYNIPTHTFKSFYIFPNLKYLSAKNSSIEYLDSQVFRGKNSLKVLDFSYNKLQNIYYDFIDNLVDLVYLNLKGNNIKSISPDFMKVNIKLEFLNFLHNDCVNQDAIGFDEINELISFIKNNC